MTTFFIIMAACMYPVLLILYGVMRYYGRPRGGVMFGAQLQLGLEKEPEVAEISRRFKREVTLWLLILAVIPLATLPVPYMSISVTFWMVWCFAAIFALQVPFARANRAVRAWKAEHGYGGERERRILVETRELDTVRSFRWTACIAPMRQYAKYKLASGKTAKSILISCGSRLAPFDIPQLREIMSYDELELDRMGDRRTATFFCISDTDSTYNFLVALAFSQMFNLLCERADNIHRGRLPHHVRVLWDEVANTGQVPNLEKLVAVIRSREVSLTLFYQQLAQCKAIYDKNAETILGNMDSVVFLGGRESSTIKEISENWLGKATIYMQTDGRTRGQSESYSQNNQRLGRELMTPSELATMPGNRCILQLRGLPPFYSKKYDLKQHPNYKYTAEADKQKNAFSLDKLINRRRRPGLAEECEVYEATVPDEALTDEDEDILN